MHFYFKYYITKPIPRVVVAGTTPDLTLIRTVPTIGFYVANFNQSLTLEFLSIDRPYESNQVDFWSILYPCIDQIRR